MCCLNNNLFTFSIKYPILSLCMITKKFKLFLFAIVLPALLLVALSYLQKGNDARAGKEESRYNKKADEHN